MGYILPGKPIANVCFKTYTYISMSQAVSFLQDFKLGHYMKIPPRSMFIVQVCKATYKTSNNFIFYSLHCTGLHLSEIIIIIIIFSLLNFLELVIFFLRNFWCFIQKK